jgi:hypothetical protein
MNKLSWREIEIFGYSCCFLICVASIAIINFVVTSRCDAIVMSGDDCGVGIGWYGLAAGFFGIGAFSAWKVYRGLR